MARAGGRYFETSATLLFTNQPADDMYACPCGLGCKLRLVFLVLLLLNQHQGCHAEKKNLIVYTTLCIFVEYTLREKMLIINLQCFFNQHTLKTFVQQLCGLSESQFSVGTTANKIRTHIHR